MSVPFQRKPTSPELPPQPLPSCSSHKPGHHPPALVTPGSRRLRTAPVSCTGWSSSNQPVLTCSPCLPCSSPGHYRKAPGHVFFPLPLTDPGLPHVALRGTACPLLRGNVRNKLPFSANRPLTCRLCHISDFLWIHYILDTQGAKRLRTETIRTTLNPVRALQA